MLVLTRKVGEVIVVGDNIRLTVVEIRGERVRIGVAAPKEVVVDRQEVHDRRKDFCGEAPALTPTPVAVIAPTPP
jgi:carbon storage regulator